MSGPWPVLAATLALGCTSSSDSFEHLDLDAGGLGEGRDQRHEAVFLGLHEALPAQQLQAGAGLGLPRRGLRPGLGEQRQVGGGRRAREGGAGLQRAAAG